MPITNTRANSPRDAVMNKRKAIKHLRDALAYADAKEPDAYRVGAMEQAIKFALAELGVNVEDESPDSADISNNS